MASVVASSAVCSSFLGVIACRVVLSLHLVSFLSACFPPSFPFHFVYVFIFLSVVLVLFFRTRDRESMSCVVRFPLGSSRRMRVLSLSFASHTIFFVFSSPGAPKEERRMDIGRETWLCSLLCSPLRSRLDENDEERRGGNKGRM